MATRSIALSESALSPSTSPSNDELTDDFMFRQLVTEDEILGVSKDLFEGGFYSNAVQEAFTALDNFVKKKTGLNHTGTRLMRAAFKNSDPELLINAGISESEKDEREGYEHLFAGSMQAIRNPTTHEFQWIGDREQALECLVFCQHLLRRAKNATLKLQP
jgi:uncharacterized protein (TIGR02391 family)